MPKEDVADAGNEGEVVNAISGLTGNHTIHVPRKTLTIFPY